MHAAMTGSRELRVRAGAIPRSFWAAESRKSGVAPARFDFFSTVAFMRCMFVCLSSLALERTCLGKKSAIKKVKSVIVAFFPIPGRIALRKCFLLAASKTTRLCDSVCEER